MHYYEAAGVEIYLYILGWVLILGFVPGFLTATPEQRVWYEQFRGRIKNGEKNPKYVPIAPPRILFSIIWTILYICMATAAYLVREEGGVYREHWHHDESGNRWPLITFWILQVVLFFYTLLFFGWKQRLLGTIDVFVGLVLTIVVGVLFLPFSGWAAALMFLTAVWETYAFILSIWILLKNTSSQKKAARSILERISPKQKHDVESASSESVASEKPRAKRSQSASGAREKK
jgi:tryptophan-rich sensory protein